MNVKHGPPLFSEGDEGEWARVTKVQAIPHSVILCEGGNPEIHKAKNGPPSLTLSALKENCG